MTVSQRLYLAVVPAIVGVFAVAGLAYWGGGTLGRRAPHVLIVVGIVASLASLVVAWRNTRYVATRVMRLAAPAQAARLDELDTIEEEVERLRRSAAEATAAQDRAQATADQRVREYAELLGDAATASTRQLDEVRMPLHILLESHFGDLNENQEEMLAAARNAADEVHTRLDRLRAIADVDRGALRLRPERVRVGDIVAMLLPGLTATAREADVTVDSNISPLMPAVAADRAWLTEALSLLANDAVRRTPPGGRVELSTVEPTSGSGSDHSDDGGRRGDNDAPSEVRAAPSQSSTTAQLMITHGSRPGRPIDVAFADRLIGAQGGSLQHGEDRTVITLLRDAPMRLAPATSAANPPSQGTAASTSWLP